MAFSFKAFKCKEDPYSKSEISILEEMIIMIGQEIK
jgi:hypothetical protein